MFTPAQWLLLRMMRAFCLCSYALLVFMGTLYAKRDSSQLIAHHLLSQLNAYIEYSGLVILPKRRLSKEEPVSWHIIRGTWRSVDDSNNVEERNLTKEG